MGHPLLGSRLQCLTTLTIKVFFLMSAEQRQDSLHSGGLHLASEGKVASAFGYRRKISFQERCAAASCIRQTQTSVRSYCYL